MQCCASVAADVRSFEFSRSSSTHDAIARHTRQVAEIDRSWTELTQEDVWFTNDVDEITRLTDRQVGKQLPRGASADNNPACHKQQRWT